MQLETGKPDARALSRGSSERADGSDPAPGPASAKNSIGAAELARENDHLRSQLERASLLLKEVDHRAKNSLQLAASILILQARQQPDTPAARELDRAVERLRTLAEIHRVCYLATDHDRISMPHWLGAVCGSLTFRDDVAVDLECPDAELPFAIAGPIGLFIGEALANAHKHAFAERGGRVAVRFGQTAQCDYVVSVSDDGKGLGDEIPHGLGAGLLAIFARQLGGEVRYEEGLDRRGVSVIVEFSLNPARVSGGRVLDT